MDLVFLGLNDVGVRIYEWLCDRDDADVAALLTERTQLDVIREVAPDIVVSVGFDHLVPGDVLDIPEQGCVNLHPSYLPYNRGKSPNVWSIVEGTPAGVTLHYMDEEFDTGRTIARREIRTSFADTGKDLHRRLEDAQFDLFTDVWPDLVAGDIDSTPQTEGEGTYHTLEDFRRLCEIDPDEEVRAKEFLDRLRALTFPPFDNATVTVDGERYHVDVDIRPADETDDEASEGFLESY
jgi:methionyl-tRNA formyltransferase